MFNLHEDSMLNALQNQVSLSFKLIQHLDNIIELTFNSLMQLILVLYVL